jgi:HEPN domain-containing protein
MAPVPPGVLLEDLCFHAQQSAEKAIKAVYRAHGSGFRYTHDLGELLTGLRSHGIHIPPELMDLTDLTSFAWEARYPGITEPVTESEFHAALKLAGSVLAWAEGIVAKVG